MVLFLLKLFVSLMLIHFQNVVIYVISSITHSNRHSIFSGPFSKSAVNFHAGCKTAMSNVVMSICIMMVLLFLAPLFKYTPLVALAAIIVVAMIGLIEIKEFRRLFKVDKFDFCICMVAFLGVVLFSMVIGLSFSVRTSPCS